MKRVVAIILVVTVILFGVNNNRVGNAFYVSAMENNNDVLIEETIEAQGIAFQDDQVQQNQVNQNEKTYIIQTKNKTKCRDVKKKFKKGNSIASTSEDYIQDKNLAVVTGNEQEIKKLSKDRDVLFIEEDSLVNASSKKIRNRKTITKEAGTIEWNIKAIKATKTNKKQSYKVKVAILDSGVDDFNDVNLKDAINLIPGEEEVLPLFWDVSGHGSSVAGIIAAKEDGKGISGINPGVEVYAAKILTAGNIAPISRVVEGIYWAMDHKVDIINISFGTATNSKALEKAIQDAYEQGILIIAAAGNGGKAVEYPAAYDEVMAVGSVDTDGIVSDYSARGAGLDVVAPGEQIKSTGGFSGTVICEGTSMAAPHVTAIASVLWQKDKTVSNEFIRQLINASANGYGDKNRYGNGLVDLNYAEKIYKKFKKNFSKKKSQEQNENGISENTSTVYQFDHVDYVEGSWEGKNHMETVTNAGTSLSAAAICRIKAGAVYPDFKISGVKGMGDYPYWHGYFKDDNNISSNYINAYIYITRMAQAIRGGNGLDTASVPSWIYASGNSTIASQMRTTVSSIDYSNVKTTLVGYYQPSDLDTLVLNSSDKAQKAQFVWGMAIHEATDAFAHSVYGYTTEKNAGWTRFFHESKNGNEFADDTTVTNERFTVAKEVAANIVRRYNANQSGDYSQFTSGCSYDCSKFKLYLLQLYLSNASGDTEVGKLFELYSKSYSFK